MPDQSNQDEDARQQYGHRLAADIDNHPNSQERSAATHDLIREMIQAGDEEEVTTDLLALEKPEEWTDADYAEYEATELDPASGERQ